MDTNFALIVKSRSKKMLLMLSKDYSSG